MRKTWCAACSNEIDADAAVRWVGPDGAVRLFCTEECRIVGEDIEPGPARDVLGEAGCGARPARRKACKAPAKKPAPRVRAKSKRG